MKLRILFLIFSIYCSVPALGMQPPSFKEILAVNQQNVIDRLLARPNLLSPSQSSSNNNSTLVSVGIGLLASFPMFYRELHGFYKDWQKSKADEPIVAQDEVFIGGLPRDLERLVSLIQNSQLSSDLEMELPSGYLLVGPPGSGKTAIARELSRRLKAGFFDTVASKFVEKYQGSGSKSVTNLYNRARSWVAKKRGNTAIVFIDEIDALGSRGSVDNYKELELTIAALLTELDGFRTRNNIITVGATNNPGAVDAALKRAGRLGNIIDVPLPDDVLRCLILKTYLERFKDNLLDDELRTLKIRETDPEFILSELIQKTDGFNKADLKEVINTAKSLLLDENTRVLVKRHLAQACDQIRARKQLAQLTYLNNNNQQ